MATNPLLISLLGGLVMSALEKGGGLGSILSPTGPAGGMPEPPPPGWLPPEFVREITTAKEDVRSFTPSVRASLIEFLSGRSVVKVEGGPIAELGAVWKVVPLQENAPNASGLIANAIASGSVVAGSLSLSLLPIGRDAPMVLVVGGRYLEGLCSEGGHFALLSPPAEKVAPPPEPKVEAANTNVEPPVRATKHKNGASTAAAETIVAIAHPSPEEGID